MGVFSFITYFLFVYLFTVFGAELEFRVKSDWLAALLRQDIAYHDKHGSNALNVALSVETKAIGEGTGYKFGLLLQSLLMMACSLGIAFWRSWEGTLVFIGCFPLIAIGGVANSMLTLSSVTPIYHNGC